MAGAQPAVVRVRAGIAAHPEGVVARADAEVPAEHPGGAGPQVGPQALVVIRTQPELLALRLHDPSRCHGPRNPDAEHVKRRRQRTRSRRAEGRGGVAARVGDRGIAGELHPVVCVVPVQAGCHLVGGLVHEGAFVRQFIHLEIVPEAHVAAGVEGVVAPLDAFGQGLRPFGLARRSELTMKAPTLSTQVSPISRCAWRWSVESIHYSFWQIARLMLCEMGSGSDGTTPPKTLCSSPTQPTRIL